MRKEFEPNDSPPQPRLESGGARQPSRQGPAEPRLRPRVWNRDFLILWQGQLVSALGDTVYAVALGFWILQSTGSTALMGTIMAVTALPRILVGPLAGVVIDRSHPRRILIAMDVVRGLAICLVGLAALARIIRIWMVFAAALIIGLGGAFFLPAVSSILPAIVPRDRLIQANSAYSLIPTGSGMIGNGLGGFLFQVLGAAFLFLFNGLSYLVSSFTLLFVRVPEATRNPERPHFLSELKDGLGFAWRIKGIRALFFVAAVLNFFGVMAFTLFLPLFQRTPGLGPARYGIAMACLAGGLLSGFLLASVLRFRPADRFAVFLGCGFLSVLAFAGMILILRFPVMIGLGFVAGAANAILNSFIPGTIQAVVPREMIGKVSALLTTLSGGLIPLAMAMAGILAESLPLRPLMAGCFFLELACFSTLLLSDSIKRFINFDPARDTLAALQ